MKRNVDSIQFLRFIAATMVVIFHSVAATNKFFKGSMPEGLQYAAGFGGAGVHLFFVISGFVMVYASFRVQTVPFSPSGFFLRRLIRIFPVYWFYAVLYLLFHQTFTAGYALTSGQVLGSSLLLPGYSSLIIGQGWTLTYELYFYLCFAIVMSLALFRGLVVMTIFFLSAISLRVVMDTTHPTLFVMTNSLLLEFLLGAWIAYFVISGVRISRTIAIGMLLLGVAAFSAGFAYGYSRLPSVLIWGVPSALVIAGLVFGEFSGYTPKFVERFSFLGDSSYSLYLVHTLLIDVVLTAYVYLFAGASHGLIAMCFALTALCIVVAHISYKLFEQRMIVFLQETLGRKKRSRVLQGKQAD